MATKTEAPRNVWHKLMDTRMAFLAEGVKKSGKNNSMKYKFFELDEIVPVAMPLFQANGIFPHTYFTAENCCLDVIDMDDTTQAIHFVAPMREWNGNAAVNPIQSLGATITYMRRYLLMLALDIVEADEMDAGNLIPEGSEVKKPATPAEKTANATAAEKPASPAPIPVVAPEKKKIPITQEKREEVKQNLTAVDGPASDLQIAQLKKIMKQIKNDFPEQKEWLTNIVLSTKSFTEISKADCERILQEASQIVAKKEA